LVLVSGVNNYINPYSDYKKVVITMPGPRTETDRIETRARGNPGKKKAQQE